MKFFRICCRVCGKDTGWEGYSSSPSVICCYCDCIESPYERVYKQPNGLILNNKRLWLKYDFGERSIMQDISSGAIWMAYYTASYKYVECDTNMLNFLQLFWR